MIREENFENECWENNIHVDYIDFSVLLNFELDENGRKFSKRVENTVGKEEITRSE